MEMRREVEIPVMMYDIVDFPYLLLPCCFYGSKSMVSVYIGNMPGWQTFFGTSKTGKVSQHSQVHICSETMTASLCSLVFTAVHVSPVHLIFMALFTRYSKVHFYVCVIYGFSLLYHMLS